MDAYGVSQSQGIGSKTSKNLNLVKLQREVLENILKVSKREEETDGCVWKILIFDTYCQNVLSTLVKVGNLRELNITLHLNLNQKGEKRDKLHGVKAYYLVQPTRENIQLIMDDFSKDLYDQVYLNFSSPADEEVLRELAVHVGNLNAVYKIKRVVQHTIEFVTMSRDLFSLNISNSYASLRTTGTKQSAQVISSAAMGLFSLFRTLRKVPFIMYQSDEKNNALLAKELEILFDQHYINSKEFEEEQSDYISQQQSQPLLILAERDTDLGSQLLHPWHYGALVHDIYRIENNKIKVAQNNSTDLHTYDLDISSDDSYWVEKMNIPYPNVAEDISERLAKWEAEYKQMTSKKDDATSMVAAMGSLNDMKDTKRLIEMHMSISTGIMHDLKSRQLDKYFEAGSTIIRDKSLRGQDKKELLALFEETGSSGKGVSAKHDLDKLRILIIILLFVQDIDALEFSHLQTAAGISNKKYLSILEKFKQQRIPDSVSTSSASHISSEGNIFNEEIGDKIGSLLGKLASKVKSQGKGILNNVKNYLPGTDQGFELSNSVRNLLETKLIAFEKLGYTLLDILNKKNISSPPKVYSEVVVFLIDGANFNEYQHIQEIAKKLNKNILYGGSEILNAETFISQLVS